MRTNTREPWKCRSRLTAVEAVMRRERGIIWLILGMGVLLLTLLLTGCFPGFSVYEGLLKEKTSVVLSEGKEYLVYFEAPCFSMSGTSSSSSARGYTDLDSVVAIYDETGNTIPNTITSGKINAHVSVTSFGITVARFRLEGNGTRSVELHVDMDAYGQFASSYNKQTGGGAVGGPLAAPIPKPSAPLPPNKLVIREASVVAITQPILFVIFAVVIIYSAIYYIRKQRTERARNRSTEQSSTPPPSSQLS